LTRRIFFKAVAATVSLLVLALAVADLFVSRVAANAYQQNLEDELAARIRLIIALAGQRLHQLDRAEFSRLSEVAGGRLTWIAPDGRVLLDSEADASRMDNHRSRPEVAEALQGRRGVARRRSPTVGTDFLYVALPHEGGALRLARPLSDVRAALRALRRQILLSAAIAFLPALLAAALLSRYFSRRLGALIEYAGHLAAGNFRAPLQENRRDELGLLAQKLLETSANMQRMVEELERERVELEKLERIRKDFVINVSHELRTPLASIQGYTETLLDGALHDPEHNVRFLNIIRQNAERLGRLVADLLTLSRLELGTHNFQFASYYVNPLMADVVESMRPLAEKKNLRLQLYPAPPDLEVFCDAEAFHQVLANLVDNAIKYTPPGGAITVGARLLVPEDHRRLVEFYVRDTGIGVPPEDLPRLFERFYRVDKARSRELGGTGLGLSIVKHLVRSMGGDVRVESVLHRGSTFYFTLPVEPTSVTASPSGGFNRNVTES
jgi:two-component system phosphate regulon sensor histidine kinase PhoR